MNAVYRSDRRVKVCGAGPWYYTDRLAVTGFTYGGRRYDELHLLHCSSQLPCPKVVVASDPSSTSGVQSIMRHIEIADHENAAEQYPPRFLRYGGTSAMLESSPGERWPHVVQSEAPRRDGLKFDWTGFPALSVGLAALQLTRRTAGLKSSPSS